MQAQKKILQENITLFLSKKLETIPSLIGWNVFALPKKDLHARKMNLHA
jgi:hypothetical protein